MSYEEPKRARRIRDRERMIARGRRVAAKWHKVPDLNREWVNFEERQYVLHQETWDDVFQERDRFARRNHDNLKRCSCHMCGNPRRRFGGGGYSILTIQEIRALDFAKDQLDD